MDWRFARELAVGAMRVDIVLLRDAVVTEAGELTSLGPETDVLRLPPNEEVFEVPGTALGRAPIDDAPGIEGLLDERCLTGNVSAVLPADPAWAGAAKAGMGDLARPIDDLEVRLPETLR